MNYCTSGSLTFFAGMSKSGTPTKGPAINSQLNHPVGVFVDNNNNLYIADTYNNRIEKIDTNGNLIFFAGNGGAGQPTTGPATKSNLNKPEGVVVDIYGNAYIADTKNYRIEKVTQ